MNVRTARGSVHSLPAGQPRPHNGGHVNDAGQTPPRILPDPNAALVDYRGLDFKEMLAACPIDGLDLERNPEPPRPVAL